jgi:V-containing nitrogenase delta subunit
MKDVKNEVQDLYKFIQERCLWQFHSRAWDREENINGIMQNTSVLLTGGTVAAESSQEKCFLADAKILVGQLKEAFPWIKEMKETDVVELIEGVKNKLIDVTLTNSLNGELKVPFY